MSWRLNDLIEKTLSKHIKEIPYEGTEVNFTDMKYSTKELIANVSVGFLKWCFKNNIKLESEKGYEHQGEFMSRRDLFNEFCKTI